MREIQVEHYSNRRFSKTAIVLLVTPRIERFDSTQRSSDVSVADWFKVDEFPGLNANRA